MHTGRAVPHRWRKSLLPSSENAACTLLLMQRKMQMSAPWCSRSVVLFSLRVKIHRIALYTHSLKLFKINEQSSLALERIKKRTFTQLGFDLIGWMLFCRDFSLLL